MVKTGVERAVKAALKNDAYVIMLRAKHNHFLTIRNFMKSAYQQFLFDQIVAKVSIENAMLWGKKSQYMDLARQLLFNGIGTYEEWLAAGMPINAFDNTQTEIERTKHFYYLCTYPKSMLISKLTFTDNINETPLTQEKDWLKNLTDLNINDFSPVSSLPFRIAVQQTEICEFQDSAALSPIINNPFIEFSTIPLFLVSVSQLETCLVLDNNASIENLDLEHPNLYNANSPIIQIGLVRT